MTDKPTPILPPGQSEERPLFVIIVIMSFLASVTMIVSTMGLRQSSAWQEDLRSSATVQITAADPVEKDAQITKALDILKTTPGILSAEKLTDAQNRELLTPWIGSLDLPDDITVPALIRIKTDKSRLNPEALATGFAKAGISAEFDDHSRRAKNLAGTWRRLQFALGFMLLLMIGATVAISGFATHSVLNARQNIISVLGQVGATDKFVGNLFVKRFLSLGFKASMTGMVLALLAAALFTIWQNAATDADGLKISLQLSDILRLIGLSVVLGTVCAFTAGYSARKSVRTHRPAL